jgi:maleylpyruvate isomerase
VDARSWRGDRMSSRAWLDEATTLMLRAVDQLDDAAFASPSALPNWTIGHIVAHLHFNAEAIGRLVTWARTGVETPMYSSLSQRSGDIESGASFAPDVLRKHVHTSTRDLTNAFDALTPAMWEHKVVTAQGRTVPATELVWMRFREVAVHGVDLGMGTSFRDLPADAVAKLVQEIVAKRLGAGEGPALAAWLTGRVNAGPALGPWL